MDTINNTITTNDIPCIDLSWADTISIEPWEFDFINISGDSTYSFANNSTHGSQNSSSGIYSNTNPYNYPNNIFTIGNTNTQTGPSNITWEPVSFPHPNLKVEGDAEFAADIKLKGKSLSEVLDNIESRLGILHPNPELEEKWEELKALSVRYKELEKDIIEKENLWSILKK